MATNENINLNLKVNTDLKGIKQMNEEVGQLEDALDAAAAAGDRVSFDKLKQELGTLKNDIGAFEEEMQYLDPSKFLEGFTRLGEGVAGTFASATAAASLFGVESEKLSAIEEKSVQIIQLLMGLESARQLLQSKGVAKALAGQAKRILGLNALTTATVVQTTATEGATVATLGLNTAMLANPAVAIAAGIAALTAAVIYFIAKNNDATKSVEDLTKKSEAYKTALDGILDAGSEQIANLSVLTEGTKDYETAIKNLLIEYADYLSKEEELRLLQADQAEAIDLVTEAMFRKAEAEAKIELYKEEIKKVIELEKKLEEARNDSMTSTVTIFGRSVGGLTASLTEFYKNWKYDDVVDDLEEATKKADEFKESIKKANEEGKKGLQVKIDTDFDADALVDAFDKLQDFTKGLSKEIGNLELQLIGDDYERQQKQLDENYERQKKDLEEIAKLSDNVKKSIDEQIKAEGLKKTSAVSAFEAKQKEYDIAVKLREEADKQLEKYKKMSSLQQMVYVDEYEAATNLVTERQKKVNELFDETKQFGLDEARIQKETNAQIITLKGKKDEIVLLDAKAEKLLDQKYALEKKILEVNREQEATKEGIALKEELSNEILQAKIDLMDDGLAKTKAQLGLDEEINQKKLDAQIDEAKARKEVFEIGTEGYNRELLNIDKLTKLKQLSNDQYLKDVTEAEKEATKVKLDTENSSNDELEAARKEMLDKIDQYALENAKDGSLKELNIRKAILTKQEELEIEQLEELQKLGLLNHNQYLAAKNNIEERYRQQRKEAELEWLQQYKDAALQAATEIANAIMEINYNQREADYEADQRALEIRSSDRAEEASDEIDRINEIAGEEVISAEEKQDKLDKIEEQRLAEDLKLRRQKFFADRRAALTDVAIQTAVALIEAAPNPLQMVLAGVTGAASAAAIRSQQAPTFRRGGLFVGNTHENGGINANLEDGEVVLNSNSMKVPALRNIASRINEMGGGVPVPPLNTPTAAQQNAMGMMGVDEKVIEAIVNRIAAIPVVLSERDVTNIQRKVRTYEEDANIG